MMSNRDIALEYIKSFCDANINALESLFTADLQFKGPFHTFKSSKDYLESLRNDPPDKCRYNILSITENRESVVLFYEYQKPDCTILIAQLFKIDNQKIKEIVLVFDTRDFA